MLPLLFTNWCFSSKAIIIYNWLRNVLLIFIKVILKLDLSFEFYFDLVLYDLYNLDKKQKVPL